MNEKEGGGINLKRASDNQLLEGAIRHRAELKAFIIKRTGRPDVADDIFQDLVVRFLDRGKTYSPDNIRSYLFSAAANAITDWGRKQQANQRLEKNLVKAQETNPALGNEMERALMAREKLARIGAALDELPAQCRQIFHMVRIEGQKHQDVADKLGVSVRTVERNLARALAHCMQIGRK